MFVDENSFDRYLAIVQSDASDAEVEIAASELGIDAAQLTADQSMRLRDARLERARGKAVESALKRREPTGAGDFGALASFAEKQKPARYSKGLAIFLFFAIAAILAGVLYFLVFAGESCRTKCCDGTCSPSVGQGTCSYHGGICNDK